MDGCMVITYGNMAQAYRAQCHGHLRLLGADRSGELEPPRPGSRPPVCRADVDALRAPGSATTP